jgi:ABC-type molybdenum transport system ATPase subunit/photorepair protein PhrA
MGLRLQDPVPEWISHIALVQDGRVKAGEKTTMLQELNDAHAKETSYSTTPVHTPNLDAKAKVFVDMQNVNIRYHERHVSYLSFRTQFTTNSTQVLKDINWTIRSGDRWHLQGANGEFVTTHIALHLIIP